MPSPVGWVEGALPRRAALRFELAEGDDPAEVLAARELGQWVRERRRPAVLHLRTVRYLSHAGADPEMATAGCGDSRRIRTRPVARNRTLARLVGRATGDELAADYLESRKEVRALALEGLRRRNCGRRRT